jgi:hypothetical protein
MFPLFPKNLLKLSLIFFLITSSNYVLAAEDQYNSLLVNKSKQANSEGYKLVKTKVWPNPICVIDSGKEIVNPGESTELKIKKSTECAESGVGYSMYKMEDTKSEHLLGYLSHRLGEGKFSVQISRFCEGDKCVFTDLNPEQNR